MANELIKMKTGTIAKLEQKTNGVPAVGLDAGTVYFAVDTTTDPEHSIGKIVYDVDNGNGSVSRVVMSTQAEYADKAGEAAKTTGITGIYPVRGNHSTVTNRWSGIITGISELVDGLTIAYYLPYDGNQNAVTLQLNFQDTGNYSANIPVYYANNLILTNQYSAGSTLILTYWATENKWMVSEYDTRNTAGATDISNKIFLVGATSQAANPQTYSDNQVYATNGQLDMNKARIAEAITLQYNSTTKSLDFIFA